MPTLQRIITLLLICAIITTQSVVTWAQPKADEDLTINVVAIRGSVQVREATDQPWKKVTPGMALKIGWELRTGLRSVVQFKIGTEHTVTIDRLGVVKVLDARRTQGKIKTNIGLKYGRTNYKVKAAGEEHESKIHAPSATLAIRGSNITVSDDATYGYAATVSETEDAEIEARGTPRPQRVVIRQEGTITGKTPPTIAQFLRRTGQPVSPALIALLFTSPGANPDVVGGRRDGFTPIEASLTIDELAQIFKDVAEFPSGGGLDVLQDIQGDQDQAAADQFVTVDDMFVINPGQLNITLNWSGFSDLDTGARDPLGAITATFPNPFGPGASTITRPGGPAEGVAGPDQLENANTLTGTEFINFPTEHLAGQHTALIRFNDFSGATAATFNLTVTQDGMQILNQNGSIDAANPAIDIPFNVPAVLPPEPTPP